jgi:hypothetical protein
VRPSPPDISFTAVVRANADTLHSCLCFDVSQEPLVINASDSGSRYSLLPMLDMGTDVFASVHVVRCWMAPLYPQDAATAAPLDKAIEGHEVAFGDTTYRPEGSM